MLESKEEAAETPNMYASNKCIPLCICSMHMGLDFKVLVELEDDADVAEDEPCSSDEDSLSDKLVEFFVSKILAVRLSPEVTLNQSGVSKVYTMLWV